MVDLKTLQDKALLIKEKFTPLETKACGRPWTRLERMLGFVGDVGALAKLCMGTENLRNIPDVKTKLGHEFADCLWSILVLAKQYDVDIEDEFNTLIAKLESTLTP